MLFLVRHEKFIELDGTDPVGGKFGVTNVFKLRLNLMTRAGRFYLRNENGSQGRDDENFLKLYVLHYQV